jgi:hypothetical protein
MDGVMRDAERLGVRNWRSKAKDTWLEAITSVKQDPTWIVAPGSEYYMGVKVGISF